MMTGQIHSFESFATLDGEGIRFAVFLAGCPLRCVYCHNPDTWYGKGQSMSPEQLLVKIKRFEPYFNKNGGVTFSGGEPLVQAKFVCEVAELLKKENIKYALDTSGGVDLTDDVARAIDNADMVILDLKWWDNENYQKYCGGSFDKMLAIGDYACKKSKKMWLRTVVVPNLNDKAECINKYVEVAKRWNNVQKYELLGFHTMGFAKYEKLGIENKLVGTKNLELEKLIELQDCLNEKFARYIADNE